MKRQKIHLIISTIFVLSFITTIMIHGVSAVSEVVGPAQIVVKAGIQNQTDMAYLTGNDSQYMTFSSNKSGDKNYYESYKIESDSDIISKYFNVTQSTYNMPVEFKDEKIDASYNSHKKVIRIQDRYYYAPPYDLWAFSNQLITQRYPVHDSSALNVINGWLEFYFLSEATNGTFMITFGDNKSARYYSISQGQNVGSNHGISFGITPIGGKTSKFFWQSSWTGPMLTNQSAIQYEPNKWYHVRLAYHFNNSWAIRINNVEVYNSSTWTMNSTLKLFNTVTMMTAIRTNASYHASHVFYIDALGLSYNLTSHNSAVPAMTFNTDYEPYVDITSHNNLNDHVADATFAAYFIFNLGNYFTRSSSAKLYLKASYTPLANGKGMIWLFNQTSKTYDKFANYTPYIEIPAEEFSFESNKSGATIIKRETYVSAAGIFSMKIDAQATNYFTYRVDYMVVEFVLGADMNQVLIVILAVLGVVVVYILYQITRRGAPRARAGARKARRNLR
ncbi:MAG: hypothetical protein Q6373_019435 [Candidatus Sigynarchaeota archaeon]